MAIRCVLIALLWIAVPYLLYPAVVALRARLAPRPLMRRRWWPSVTVVIAAQREVASLEAKLANLVDQSYPAARLRVVLVCDGGSEPLGEETVTALRHAAERWLPGRACVLALPRGGKAVALNAAVHVTRDEILVLTDARQRLSRDAIRRLVEALGDPEVGMVGGALRLEGGGALGAYWRLEAWLRRIEARAGSSIGVSGALCALRRSLYAPMPAGLVLDDVWLPMRVRRAGRRVAFERRAVAYDRPLGGRSDFQRKVRTLAGNFQLLFLDPRLLLPWHPSWLGFVGHKLMRLGVPWAMLGLVVATVFLETPWRWALGTAQLAGYGLAVLGALGLGERLRIGRLARLAEAFVEFHAAAALGLGRFLLGPRRIPW